MKQNIIKKNLDVVGIILAQKALYASTEREFMTHLYFLLKSITQVYHEDTQKELYLTISTKFEKY
jgi:hypothetical protein